MTLPLNVKQISFGGVGGGGNGLKFQSVNFFFLCVCFEDAESEGKESSVASDFSDSSTCVDMSVSSPQSPPPSDEESFGVAASFPMEDVADTATHAGASSWMVQSTQEQLLAAGASAATSMAEIGEDMTDVIAMDVEMAKVDLDTFLAEVSRSVCCQMRSLVSHHIGVSLTEEHRVLKWCFVMWNAQSCNISS